MSNVDDSSCQSFRDVDSRLFFRFLSITLAFPSKSQRFLRVGLAVPILSTVAALRKMVAEEGSVPVDEVRWNYMGLSTGWCSAN